MQLSAELYSLIAMCDSMFPTPIVFQQSGLRPINRYIFQLHELFEWSFHRKVSSDSLYLSVLDHDGNVEGNTLNDPLNQ